MGTWHNALAAGALVAMAAGAASAAPKIVLVQEGRPAASIVVSEEATRAAQFAAYELQYHVERITGARLPITTDREPGPGARILVGESRATWALDLKPGDLRSQEYLVRFLPGPREEGGVAGVGEASTATLPFFNTPAPRPSQTPTLILLGRDKEDRGIVKYSPTPDAADLETWPSVWDETGTMTAVYDFLERHCGVRWFNPTEAGIDCPQKKTLVVGGSSVRRSPAFRYRYSFYPNPESYDAYTGLWPAGTDGYKRYEAAAYEGLHKQFPDAWRRLFAHRGLVRLFLFRMREGGEKCVANHSLYGYYARFWEKEAGRPDAFVAKHADWFAQGYEGTPPQMCYTNPGLIRQVAQDARDYFDGRGINPWTLQPMRDPNEAWGENFFCVEPMDNASFCKCERCQRLIGRPDGPRAGYSTGEHSDYFFRFVNEVAKEVGKTHPQRHIVTLAYMTHAYPPSFRLEPNVAVQYCFASNRAPYARQEYENDLKALNAWAQQAKERPLYLWLYYTFPVEVANNGKFHCFPGFFAPTINEQMKLFHRKGFQGMFHCGFGQDVEAYVTYKLQDDPDQDFSVLLNDYFTRYYGGAAGPMKRLYLAMAETYCSPENWPERPGHESVQIAWGRLGTPERLAQFATLLQQAKDAATTEMERRRVALFEMGTWDYMKAGSQRFQARMSSPIPALKASRVPEANGDPVAVEWSKSAALQGAWNERGQDKPSARKLAGRAAHDGQFLYLELTDACDPGKLVTSPQVCPFDDWEIFVAGQRALPYRQFMTSPSGTVLALSHGEVNWRMNVPLAEHGVKSVSDTSAPGKWSTRLAIPLASLTKEGVQAGGKFYLNVVRVTSPQIAGTGGLGIDTWVSFCTVHDVDRLAEVTLEP